MDPPVNQLLWQPQPALEPEPAIRFPIACLAETKLPMRYKYAKAIKSAFQQTPAGFCVEQSAAILLVELKDLEGNGPLPYEKISAYQLKDRLCDISPFCKNYMLHLDPRNLNQDPERNAFDPRKLNRERWSHAIPQLPEPQPGLASGMSIEQIELSMHYRSGVNTVAESLPLDFHKEAEKNCRVRDQDRCAITESSNNPRVFWFYPKGLNDTMANNNASLNLEGGCFFLSNIDLYKDNIQSARELGKTHHMWNMLCVDRFIYDALTQGLCALKSTRSRELGEGLSEVELQFFWMPELYGRFNEEINLEQVNDCIDNEKGTDLSVDLTIFEREGCPLPELVKRHWPAWDPPKSGKTFTIKMPSDHVTRFTTMVQIHWACVTFTALCGGAGRAWCLTGNNQQNGRIQPRDKEFLADKDKESKGRGSRKSAMGLALHCRP